MGDIPDDVVSMELTPAVKGDRDRATYLGGSDAAAIVGEHPYKSAFQVYLVKRGLAVEEEVGEPAFWGSLLEPLVLQKYADERGSIVVGTGRRLYISTELTQLDEILGELRHGKLREAVLDARHQIEWMEDPIRPYRGGHPDGLEIEPGTGRIVAGVEAKTASAYLAHEWGDEGTDQIPAHYLLQCVHYQGLDFAERERRLPWKVPVLFGGQRFAVYEVPFHEDLVARLVAMEEAFWGRIQDGDAPEPGASGQTGRWLNRIVKSEPGKELVIDHSHQLAAMARDYRRLHLETERWAARKREQGNLIRVAMDDVERLRMPGATIWWRPGAGKVTVDHACALVEFRNRIGFTVEPWTTTDILEILDEAIAAHTTVEDSPPRRFNPKLAGLDRLIGGGHDIQRLGK